MGYESKCYVVNKTHLRDIDDKRFWAEVIAMFDLCKVNDISEQIRNNYHATDTYILADDGNTKIIEDAYGEPLIEIPIKDLISILEENIEKNPHYRRYNPFLCMLKGFNPDEWNNLVVLHYGY
jgi:hypothetical protein